MSNKLSGLKNMIWAAGIVLCLVALLIGFFYAAVSRYYGPKEKPVLNLSSASTTDSDKSSDKSEVLLDSSTSYATAPTGELKTLAETADGGQSYIDSLAFLCDSNMSPLKSSGLTAGQVWVNSAGLPMDDIANWNIIYPGDGSSISPANAAMVAKPKILVISVGGDGSSSMAQDSFVSGYTNLVNSIISASPDTKIICCSVFPTTSAYAGSDGLKNESAAQVNEWIQQVCIATGAWYADCAYPVSTNGSLMSEFAAAQGKGLNSTGLSAVLSYFRTHALVDHVV